MTKATGLAVVFAFTAFTAIGSIWAIGAWLNFRESRVKAMAAESISQFDDLIEAIDAALARLEAARP